jgi:hypothetical protein
MIVTTRKMAAKIPIPMITPVTSARSIVCMVYPLNKYQPLKTTMTFLFI